jgi:hypothetical protein
MITSFEVGSVFKIVNQATPQLRTILKAVTELDTAVEATRKNLTGLARTKLVGVGNQFKAITKDVVAFDRSIMGVAATMGRMSKASEVFAGIRTEIAGTSRVVGTLGTEWRGVAVYASEANAAMRAASRVKGPKTTALTTGTDAALASATVLADVWRSISGEIGTSAARARLLARGTLPATARANLPRGSVPFVPTPSLANPDRGRGGGRHGPRQGWHLGRFGGSIPVAGGHVHASTGSTGAGVAAGAGLFGIYELMKHAEEPMHQEAMLKLLGIDQPTIGRMSGEARDIAIAVPGSGYSKNMQNMGELYSIVGAEGAMAIAPKLAEIDRVQSIVGGKGKDQGSAYVLTRATELMGKLTNPVTHQVDMKLFGSVIDNMSKMSIASHGKVTPEEWLNYAKQAGPAAGNLSVEGLYTTSAIIQAMGGNRAGTAAAAIQRQFAGGVMTASKAKELEELGIFKPGDYEVGKGGHVLVKNDAAKSFVDKLQKDPLDAVVSELIPALEKHGYTTNEAITKELYRFLGTAPEQREIYEIIRGREQIKQERERAMAALPPGAAISSLNQNDPEAVTSAFTKSFTDLLGALGAPLMKDAIPGIVTLTSALNNLSAAAGKHQTVTGIVSSTAAGAGVGAAIGFGAGWLGGPLAPVTVPAAMGIGALVGGGIGAAWGTAGAITNYLNTPSATPSGSPFPEVGSGAAGTPNEKAAWNVVPPAPVKQTVQVSSTINLDGRQIAQVVTNHQVADGNGPAQGSPYPDTTRGGSSFDFALVN